MDESKYPGAFVEHDPEGWEYDCGPTEFTGEIASPHINTVLDGLMNEAFPEGREAYQKQQQAARKNLIHEAIIFAARKHAGQVRKGADIPYITHPMEVMQILTENGCTEKVIVAGILHDTLEDTGTSPAEIMELFGEDILKIVTAESEDKSKTWKERKQATIDHLSESSLEVKLVCCADKLSNLRSMAADMEAVGDRLWERFNAPKSDIEWYYRQIFERLFDLGHTGMYQEYYNLLDEVFGRESDPLHKFP